MANKLITIKTYTNSIDANVDRIILEGYGINSFIIEIETIGLQVDENFVEKASALIIDRTHSLTEEHKIPIDTSIRRASIIGLILPPVGVYSLLLWFVNFIKTKKTNKNQLISVSINFLNLAVVSMLVYSLLGSPTSLIVDPHLEEKFKEIKILMDSEEYSLASANLTEIIPESKSIGGEYQAYTLFLLGITNFNLKHYTEAEINFREAYEIYDKVFPHNESWQTIIFNPLDYLIQAMEMNEKYKESIPLFEKLINLSIEIYGENSEITANNKYHFASTLSISNDYTRAKSIFKSLKTNYMLFPIDALEFSNCHIDYEIGVIENTLKKFKEAESFLVKSKKCFEKLKNWDIREPIDMLESLVYSYFAQGKYIEALEVSLELDKLLGQVENPDSLVVINNNRILENLKKKIKWVEKP